MVQPQTDGVWVEVDYLTDLDQDGVYEMLDGADAPVSDCMTAQGALTAWTAQPDTLSAGSTYILSAQSLSAGAAAALAARNTPAAPSPWFRPPAHCPEQILYCVWFLCTTSLPATGRNIR